MSLLINNCINIEKNLKDINLINESIKKYNQNNNINYEFYSDIENFIDNIKNFGLLLSSFNTLILKNNKIITKFLSLIGPDIKLKKMNLIYRSSRDELNYLSIVNKINNKSNLIFLYKTGKNKIFGTYIKTKLENIDIKGSRKYYKDENAFCFSLNNNKKYKILVPEYAIGIDSESYILIGNNKNNNGFYCSKNYIYDQDLINKTRIYDFAKNCEMTEESGELKELEIFELELR